MAGIINQRKSVLDYKITENGRAQMCNGDIRIEYASLSDSSIVYEKDFEKSKSTSFSVVDKDNVILFEVDTKTLTNINNEFDLDNTFSFENSNILNNQINLTEDNSITFDNASNVFFESNSLGKSLKNLRLLQSRNYIKSGDNSFIENGFSGNAFDFKNPGYVKNYLTLKYSKTKYSRIPAVINDKRFRHKKSFMKLVPVQEDGEKIYNEKEDMITIDHVFKRFSKLNYDRISDRDDLLKEIVEALDKDVNVLKNEYIIKKKSDFDSFIFNMYEENERNDSIEKLAIIESGKFINDEGKFQKVFLVGKLINTKTSDKEIDSIYNFKDGNIKNNTPNKNFAAAAYYSFVNLFTIVVE